MFDMVKIGKRIAELRKRKNITQMELADLMGISFQAVSNWERGNSMPDISKLPELSELFGVSIDEIICGKSKAIEAVANGNLVEMVEKEEISKEELADVVPLIKPDEMKKMTIEVKNRAKDYVEATVDSIKDLSSNEQLEKCGKASANTLGDGTTKNVDPVSNLKAVISFLPHMDEDGVYGLAKIAFERGESITDFLPHMYEDDILELAKEML